MWWTENIYIICLLNFESTATTRPCARCCSMSLSLSVFVAFDICRFIEKYLPWMVIMTVYVLHIVHFSLSFLILINLSFVARGTARPSHFCGTPATCSYMKFHWYPIRRNITYVWRVHQLHSEAFTTRDGQHYKLPSFNLWKFNLINHSVVVKSA